MEIEKCRVGQSVIFFRCHGRVSVKFPGVIVKVAKQKVQLRYEDKIMGKTILVYALPEILEPMETIP